MSKEWFDKHWASAETLEFVEWWLGDYGSPDDYSPDDAEQNEYWVRRGFALMGWLASTGQDSGMEFDKENSIRRMKNESMR